MEVQYRLHLQSLANPNQRAFLITYNGHPVWHGIPFFLQSSSLLHLGLSLAHLSQYLYRSQQLANALLRSLSCASHELHVG